MPRVNRRRPDVPIRVPRGSDERHESWRGEDYAVRSVTGQGATKPYRCPGCQQEIKAGVPHVVVWPGHDLRATDRRHWHTPCWSARDTRR